MGKSTLYNQPINPFTRGYLLWHDDHLPDKLAPFCSHWSPLELGTQTLFYDPLIECHTAISGPVMVIVLGRVMNVLDFDQSGPEIAADIAAALWQSDPASDLSPLAGVFKPLAGSHVIFARKGPDTYLSLDAAGSYPACYLHHMGQTVVASHPTLLGLSHDLHPSPLAIDWITHPEFGKGGRYMPGLETLFAEVTSLTPNHFFCLNTATNTRYFPDQPFRERPLDEIVSQLVPMLQGQCLALAKAGTYRLQIGLSGGMDSRLTLAASRPIKDSAEYVTYFTETSPVFSQDIKIATQLAKMLDLPHRSFKAFGATDLPEGLDRAWHIATQGAQGPLGINRALSGQFVQTDLHVRSNILEVIRGFYTRNAANVAPQFDAAKLARLFRPRLADAFIPHFRRFMTETDFTESALQGFHFSDMLYWEHLVPGWVGALLRGNRMTVDTHILYNCRLILEMMLSRPVEDRNKAVVIQGLIGKMWPEVLDAPIFSASQFVTLEG